MTHKDIMASGIDINMYLEVGIAHFIVWPVIHFVAWPEHFSPA